MKLDLVDVVCGGRESKKFPDPSTTNNREK